MQNTLILAIGIALGTGVVVGIQSIINSWAGAKVGPFGVGLLVAIAGGVVASLILVLFVGKLPRIGWASIRETQFGIVVAGAIIVFAIAGTSFALPRTGIAAGVSAIIMGQMLVGVLVDSTGWGGVDRIPLDAARLAGLVFLAVAVWLLVPRSALS